MEEKLTKYEKTILDKIKIGLLYDEVVLYLKSKQIAPSSKRSIELAINSLKKRYNCKTLPSLIHQLTKKKLI